MLVQMRAGRSSDHFSKQPNVHFPLRCPIFNADYIAKIFIETVRDKNLKVTLTWDDGMTAPETRIRKKLRKTLKGNLDGWIVRCGGGRQFANAYHEKVAVQF